MNKRYIPYVFLIGIVIAMVILWWQDTQNPKKGSIPSESSQIEVIPITPSQKFSDLNPEEISTLALQPPAAENAEGQAASDSELLGELRYVQEGEKLVFSVYLMMREKLDQVNPDDEITESTESAEETSSSSISDLFLWIKGKSGIWQPVCQVEEGKGGWQCGGSLPINELPVVVSVVQGAAASPERDPVILEGTLQAP